MPNFYRNFVRGIMDKDSDERLLPEGVMRHAENITVMHSEGSDVGSVQNFLSNSQLTNINFGVNPVGNGGFEDKKNLKLYWLVKSDTGSYLVEYDIKNKVSSIIIGDTRIGTERVFNLSKDFFCTAIDKIYNENEEDDLMLITDDNMPPLCFNISRMKSLGINNFDKEDILMIKKPPRFAPVGSFINTGSSENFLEENFISFCYKYQYLDGEYSALSSYTNYKFSPKKFDLDFETFENKGMINSFNAIRLTFNTGDKRVTDIQLVFKRSNSNALFLIETFNKENEGWGHNENRSYVFSNNKKYTFLPSKEIGRSFDNVPRKAKAQLVIDNTVVYGNYLEQWDLVDRNNKKINLNYLLSIIQKDLNAITLPIVLQNGSSTNDRVSINFQGVILKKETRITLNITLKDITYNIGKYSSNIDFILNKDYRDAAELATDPDFITYVENAFTNNFISNYVTTPPGNSVISTRTGFSIFSSSATNIIINAPTITYVIDNTPSDPNDNPINTSTVVSYFGFDGTSVQYFDFETSASTKSNRSYEVGFVYLEEYNRATTVLTIPKNTVFIPHSFAITKNSIKVSIDQRSLPPSFSDRYKIVVKSMKSNYQTLYTSVFYEDGLYRWIKLDGENKDKVKEGDTLIVKKDMNGPLTDLIKIKVLEIKSQEKDFINGNNDEDGQEIKEPAGLYMKIKPSGFSIDYSNDEFFFDEASGRTVDNRPFIRIDDLSTMVNGSIVDLKIPQGSVIKIKLQSNGRDRGLKTFEKTYVSQANYDNFKQWFDATVTLPLAINENDSEKYTNVFVARGFPSGNNGFNPDPAGYLFLIAEGITPGNGGSRRGYLYASLNIRLVDGFCIFETEPVQIDEEIFYQSEQTFNIIDGFHQGNIQNQSALQPAIIELDYFNCFCQGNGAESFIIKDAFNKNSLNVDLRPSAVSVAKYKAVRRQADLTIGEPYVESSNINGINVFNISTFNFKELDKQYGSIQKLFTRDNDILVLKEFKASKVMYKKDLLYNADGTSNVAVSDKLLGPEVPYLGENGIGTKPESFYDNDYQIYYANPNQGVITRLSIDGTTNIISGMVGYFRDLFKEKPKARMIGGYDPYTNQYYFSAGEEPVSTLVVNCGNTIAKNNQTTPFTYQLRLNDLSGQVILPYNITSGNATITAVFNNATYVASNVTGVNSLEFTRNTLVQNIVTVTVTPVSSSISYEISNVCPLGSELKIVSIVLNDSEDISKTITNRFAWGNSALYASEDIFTDTPVSRFQTEIGLEGNGKFPLNNSVFTIQSFKDLFSSGQFLLAECNRLGYLITDNIYGLNNIDTILSAATFLTITEIIEPGYSEIKSGNFLFNRTDTDEILYLIWDYTNRKPILSNDTASVEQGQSKIINVLENDEVVPNAITLSIFSNPTFGTAIINPDKTISYTHDGTNNYEDSFVYEVNNGNCTSTAEVTISIGVSCSDAINASGGTGIYEAIINVGTAIGFTGIKYNAQGVPDRFQIFHNDILVADSKYVGDALAPGPPTSYGGLLGTKSGFRIFNYMGGAFVDTGNVEPDFTVIQSDIANNINEPIDGNGTLLFNKSTATPTNIKIRVTGTSGTAWSLEGICPIPAEDAIAGNDKFVFGLFDLSTRGNSNKSINVFLGTSPAKFYTNRRGDVDFTWYGWTETFKYFNDGVNWWEITNDGTILSTGTL